VMRMRPNIGAVVVLANQVHGPGAGLRGGVVLGRRRLRAP
jgi:hypothetical protein